MSMSGSKIREQVAHFLVDIHRFPLSRSALYVLPSALVSPVYKNGPPLGRAVFWFYNKCWGLVDTPVHKTPCLTIK